MNWKLFACNSLLALLTLVTTTACLSLDSVDPYPPLAEQRERLKNKRYVTPTRILDSLQLMADLIFLSSDTCQGRKPGTAGHLAAQQRIMQRMREHGLDSFENSLIQQFGKKLIPGRNIVGYVKGREQPGKYIVISAHYDHLGISSKGAVFYGADDNASGVACLLALAKYYSRHPHQYSLVFVAFDKEESGLEGAEHFAKKFKHLYGDSLRFNLNMDMIGRSDQNEIFAVGLRHYPQFKYLLENVQPKTNTILLAGHDSGPARENWTWQSDHFAFHQLEIPFIYIGVENHADYHRPTDTWDKINLGRYLENCNMIAIMINALRP